MLEELLFQIRVTSRRVNQKVPLLALLLEYSLIDGTIDGTVTGGVGAGEMEALGVGAKVASRDSKKASGRLQGWDEQQHRDSPP